MAVTAVELYERLREKLGTEEASLLVRYIEEAVERRAATKEDLLELRHALEESDSRNRRELEEKIGQLEEKVTRLEKDLQAVKHTLERRMDRHFYILLIVIIILNGEKVLAFLNTLLSLVR